MKKSIATIAASLVMITGLAPMAYAGPGNSDFGHSRQEAAHERRDARHEERRTRQEEPSTPDTPSTPGESGVASGAGGASGNSSVQNRRLAPAATTSTPSVTPIVEARSSVIFLSAPKVVRQKQRMNVSAYCVLDGEKA
ncbi:MAG: hypothetical protein GY911_09860, partial [Actinomycetales bacterium]|nr:hypothetical protein [Actinomycetales bacterium]